MIGRNLGSRTHTGGIDYLLARALYPLLIPVSHEHPRRVHFTVQSSIEHLLYQTNILDQPRDEWRSPGIRRCIANAD